jgi:serine palmitoyltransferase
MHVPAEYRRHNHYFDCYNNLDESEPTEETALEVDSKVAHKLEPGHFPTRIDFQARLIREEALVEADATTINKLVTTTNDNHSGIAEEQQEEQPIESQFGPIGDQTHQYISQHMGGPLPQHIVDEPSYFYILTTYISYMILIAIGHVRDFFGKQFKPAKYKDYSERDGYAALNSDFDNFYFRRLKMRMDDCFGRP